MDSTFVGIVLEDTDGTIGGIRVERIFYNARTLVDFMEELNKRPDRNKFYPHVKEYKKSDDFIGTIDILDRKQLVQNIIEVKKRLAVIFTEKNILQKDIAKIHGFNHSSICRALSPNNVVIPGYRMLTAIVKTIGTQYV